LEAALARAGVANPVDADSAGAASLKHANGSWWGASEGSWVHREGSKTGTPGTVSNGHGVSPSSSGGTARDSTDWGMAYAYSWYSSHDSDQPSAAAFSAAHAQHTSILAVTAEAADDWHQSVRDRAHSYSVPDEVCLCLCLCLCMWLCVLCLGVSACVFVHRSVCMQIHTLRKNQPLAIVPLNLLHFN
jgi:hypothetical protein